MDNLFAGIWSSPDEKTQSTVKLSRAGRLRWGESGNLPGWQLCRGISGSFRVEWVAGFVWNQWQPWSGIRSLATQSLPFLLNGALLSHPAKPHTLRGLRLQYHVKFEQKVVAFSHIGAPFIRKLSTVSEVPIKPESQAKALGTTVIRLPNYSGWNPDQGGC